MYKRNLDSRHTCRIHLALWVYCCRFINHLYHCWFLAGVEYRTQGMVKQ